MTIADNRPLIVVGVVGAIAVLVMVGGIALGDSNTVGDGGWRDRLAGLHNPASLSSQDFTLTTGSCQVAGAEIVVTGECTLTVGGSGLFAFGSATRRATVTIPTSPTPVPPVAVRTVVENVTVARTMQPADTVDVVFGRSGGTLQLTCQDVPSCRVTLSSPSSGG